jgi:hypothetical protein
VVLNPSRQTLLTPVKQIDQTNQRNLSRLPRSESVWGEMGLALWSVKTTPWGLALWSVKTTPWGLALWSVKTTPLGAYFTGTK